MNWALTGGADSNGAVREHREADVCPPGPVLLGNATSAAPLYKSVFLGKPFFYSPVKHKGRQELG